MSTVQQNGAGQPAVEQRVIASHVATRESIMKLEMDVAWWRNRALTLAQDVDELATRGTDAETAKSIEEMELRHQAEKQELTDHYEARMRELLDEIGATRASGIEKDLAASQADQEQE